MPPPPGPFSQLFRSQADDIRSDIPGIAAAKGPTPVDGEDASERTPVSESPEASSAEDLEASLLTDSKRIAEDQWLSDPGQQPSPATRGNPPAESHHGEPAVYLAVTKGGDGIECRLASERNALIARVRERAEGSRGVRRLLLLDLAERLQHRPARSREEGEDAFSPGSIVFVACLALGLLVSSIAGLLTGQAFPALVWGAALGALSGVALALALPALFRGAREARR